MRARIFSIVIEPDEADGPVAIQYEGVRQWTLPETGDSTTILDVEEITGYNGRRRITWWERV